MWRGLKLPSLRLIVISNCLYWIFQNNNCFWRNIIQSWENSCLNMANLGTFMILYKMQFFMDFQVYLYEKHQSCNGLLWWVLFRHPSTSNLMQKINGVKYQVGVVPLLEMVKMAYSKFSVSRLISSVPRIHKNCKK